MSLGSGRMATSRRGSRLPLILDLVAEPDSGLGSSPGSPAARAALRSWYRPRRRRYPWREGRPDPYHVLVSEVMLQQTQAARVAPAYVRFVGSFPTVEALAAAPRSQVLRAWSGLG